MTARILGLVVFRSAIGAIFADGWRSRQVERLGLNKWKGIYSSVARGFRVDPHPDMDRPRGTGDDGSPRAGTRSIRRRCRTAPAFTPSVAAYVRMRIKAAVGQSHGAGR